jgi:hypothetical protein
VKCNQSLFDGLTIARSLVVAGKSYPIVINEEIVHEIGVAGRWRRGEGLREKARADADRKRKGVEEEENSGLTFDRC